MDSPSATPQADTGAYPLIDALAPAPRPRFLWRWLLGCLIVLLASAGASAVAVLEQVHTLVQDISVNKPLKVDSKALAHSYFGRPETLLMVGDDWRAATRYYPHAVPHLANEMLLVRIDPSKPWISMMSVPRELWVAITPPNGATYTNRLNSAYTWGATTLVTTIKQITGLSVNHVIATTFAQFEHAIDTLGCVYDTIDERYYHNNANGGDQYQNIDLQPGYQCLSGNEAEQFVSYRHTDSSQIRDSRDQSFLLAVKQQYGSQLASSVGKFERVFGETVRTDSGLRSQTEILNLANLLISAAGLRVRQVPFEAGSSISVPPGDLTATPEQIQQSVHNFLHGNQAAPTRQVATISHKVSHRSVLAHLPLTPTLASNVATEKAAAASLHFTAEFPKVQNLAGSAVPVAPQCTQLVQACIRNYVIHATNGAAFPAYVEVFSNGDLGQFYDVQGTTWTGAPLFTNPNQTLRVGRRTYDLYYDGTAVKMIAWHEYGAVYWVRNTLTNAVSNGELLAIAEQTAPVIATRNTPPHQRRPILQAFSVPTQKPPTSRTPPLEAIGRVGGLVTVALLPLGLLAVFLSRRRLLGLRGQVHAAVARTAVLETQLATASGGYRQMVRHGAAANPMPQPRDPRFGDAAPVPYNTYQLRRSWVLVAVGLALVAAAAAAVYIAIDANAGGQASETRIAPAPSAPVAVLYAGSASQAAHRHAVDLVRHRVHVVGIGHLGGAAPAEYEVLYTPGEARQALLLAGILKAQHPLVAPIDQAATQAAGAGPRLIVVIP